VVILEDGAWKRPGLKLGGVPQHAIMVTLTVFTESSLLVHANILALLMTIMSAHHEALEFLLVTLWAFIATPQRVCSSSNDAHGTDGIFVMVLVCCTSVLILCAIDQSAVLVPSAGAFRVGWVWVQAEGIRAAASVTMRITPNEAREEHFCTIGALVMSPAHISLLL
jgi:hypothetical protein